MMPDRTSRACDIEGVVEFSVPVYRDSRGWFTNPFRDSDFSGLFTSPNQGSASRSAMPRPRFPIRDVSFNASRRGVLRGVHYTSDPPGRAKYVFCPHGRVRDYVVDLRVGSPTFGRWRQTELSGDNGHALYIPVGVGHAFVAIDDNSVIVYLMSEEYVPHRELAVCALDPELGLPIPPDVPITRSERDAVAPTLAEARERGLLPAYQSCLNAEASLWQ